MSAQKKPDWHLGVNLLPLYEFTVCDPSYEKVHQGSVWQTWDCNFILMNKSQDDNLFVKFEEILLKILSKMQLLFLSFSLYFACISVQTMLTFRYLFIWWVTYIVYVSSLLWRHHSNGWVKLVYVYLSHSNLCNKCKFKECVSWSLVFHPVYLHFCRFEHHTNMVFFCILCKTCVIFVAFLLFLLRQNQQNYVKTYIYLEHNLESFMEHTWHIFLNFHIIW